MVNAVAALVVAGIFVLGRTLQTLHRIVYKTFQLVNGSSMVNMVTIKLINMKVWVSFG